jgi:hypothetical protein
VDKSNGFCLGGADCTRASEALGPLDVARSSERTDEQEQALRMHGNGTEGGSQQMRARRRRAAPPGNVIPRTRSTGRGQTPP